MIESAYHKIMMTNRKILENFANKTTLHGVSYVIDASVPIARKLIWCILLLLIYGGFTAIIVLYIRDYLKYEYVVSIKTMTPKAQKFPAITVCNLNQFSKTHMHELYPNTYMLMDLLQRGDDISSFLENSTFVEEMSTNYALFAQDIARRKNETFVSCKANSWDLVSSCDPFLSEYNTVDGVCYSFHSKKVIKKNGAIYKKHSGTSAAVWFTLDIGPEDYFYSRSNGEGALLYVHSPGEPPYTERGGILISPGTSTMIGVQKIISKRLPEPYTKGCIDTTTNRGYSENVCLNECMENILRFCQCNIFDTSSEGCSILDILQCLSTTVIDFDTPQCFCKPACHQVSYTVSSTTTKFPHQNSAQRLQINGWPLLNHSAIASKYAEIYVFFQTLNTDIYTQTPVLPVTQMVSNLGGLIGLFLGASIVTVMECAELVILLTKKVLQRRKEREKTVVTTVT